MNSRVISHYDFFNICICFEKHEELQKKHLSWYAVVRNEDKNTIEESGRIDGCYNYDRLNTVLESEKLRYVIKQAEKIQRSIRKKELQLILKIEIIISDRYFYSSVKRIEERRNVIGITMCYSKKDKCICSDHYSGTFEKFDPFQCINRLYKNYEFALNVSSCDEIGNIPQNILVHFNSFPASVLNHELFGHYFELDSARDEASLDGLTIHGKPDVYDDPREKLAGFCIFDDCGEVTKRTNLLIAGKIQANIAIKNKRAGEKWIIPRMTNIIVRPKIIFHPEDRKFIEVYSIKRAKLHKDRIILYINASYLHEKSQYYRLPLIKIETSVRELMERIEGYGSDECFFSTTECLKKKDGCGGVGGFSPDMYIRV